MRILIYRFWEVNFYNLFEEQNNNMWTWIILPQISFYIIGELVHIFIKKTYISMIIMDFFK